MGIEKENSKNGGGYVGGFFQLFDWTAKSRKKLFSSKSELPDNSKQGKIRDGNFPTTWFHLMDGDETMGRLSIRGGSNFSCASSVTDDDDGFGAKAPGVVARLMGLDSMPTSSFSEPNSTPFFDTQSLRETSQSRMHSEYCHDPQIMYSGNLPNKEDVNSNPQRMSSRPIEKFQTEILPPRSAKSIPITHHKLLSPIKTPGFIPSQTADHIMEAAARMIEPGPQITAKTRIYVTGSSSTPLKLRNLKEKLEVSQKMSLVGPSTTVTQRAQDLKEKVETSNGTSSRLQKGFQKPAEPNAAKYMKGQPLNKSWNGSSDTQSFRVLPEREGGSSCSRDKGKSISLAVQAKVNVQRRGSFSSTSTPSLAGNEEQNEDMPSHSFRSQPNTQRSLPRKPSVNNASGALRQNSRKQNSLVDREKLSKSGSNSQGRKPLSTNSSLRHKNSGKTGGSKTGTRKLGSETSDSERGLSRKKRSIDGNLHSEKNRVFDNTFVDNKRKGTESSPAMDRDFSWAEESKKRGVDVVSFTFTTPLTRPMQGYDSSGQLVQKSSGCCIDNGGKRLMLDTDSMKLSSVGCNLIRGDGLSSLLDQKLRESTNTIESSSHNSVKESGSSYFLQDQAPRTPIFHPSKEQNVLQADNSGSSYSSEAFSTNFDSLKLRKFQRVDESEECSGKSNDSHTAIYHRGPSPVSVLQPSFSTEISSSLNSTDCSTEESSAVQAHLGFGPKNKFSHIDGNADLSDSASSTSTGIASHKHAHTLVVSTPSRSNNWELSYVQKILYNLEFMFRDYALGLTSQIINPHLFNRLESQKDKCFGDDTESQLERKVVFDCVSECIHIKCGQYVGVGCKTWLKGAVMVRRKERLAEEVWKEISRWKSMGDCMVDELVDKDMSSQHGRWLDFEADAFSLGAEIGDRMCNALIDEVVADVFGFNR